MEELDADKKALDELKAKLDAKFEETKTISDKMTQFDAQLDALKKNQDADKGSPFFFLLLQISLFSFPCFLAFFSFPFSSCLFPPLLFSSISNPRSQDQPVD